MHELSAITVEQRRIQSLNVNREVVLEIYQPQTIEAPSQLSLLLINDGQHLEEMHFATMLDGLYQSHQIGPLLCVGIYAGEDRKQEYGTAHMADYEGRGHMAAAAYQRFLVDELIPYIHTAYCVESFSSIAIAGFSLGGLSAMDTVWNHPHLFSIAGAFSGSFWWRTKSLHDDYNDDTDRIMHQQIRKGIYHPGLRFYFTTGSLDETADRNNNGIIDSIDDTLALMDELEKKGYNTAYDVKYINYEDGRHDMATWARSMPHFLLWGWGRP